MYHAAPVVLVQLAAVWVQAQVGEEALGEPAVLAAAALQQPAGGAAKSGCRGQKAVDRAQVLPSHSPDSPEECEQKLGGQLLGFEGAPAELQSEARRVKKVSTLSERDAEEEALTRHCYVHRAEIASTHRVQPPQLQRSQGAKDGCGEGLL